MESSLMLLALSAGLAAADVHSTFDCFRKYPGICQEANPVMKPFMGGSEARAHVGVQALNLGVNAIGWKLKKDGHKQWWVPATVSASSHGVAFGFNLRLK